MMTKFPPVYGKKRGKGEGHPYPTKKDTRGAGLSEQRQQEVTERQQSPGMAKKSNKEGEQ
jgi:hypothetical protein